MLSDEDVRYITTHFRPLEALCAQRGEDPERLRTLIAQGRMPKPTYVLDDGTEMLAPDYFDLFDRAGGVDALREHFISTYRAQDFQPDLADAEWEAYLSGEYGACLRSVSPENIVHKGRLMARITELVNAAEPTDEGWRAALSEAVDGLDEIEREFADYDRVRFGGPVSRDRLITSVRRRYSLS